MRWAVALAAELYRWNRWPLKVLAGAGLVLLSAWRMAEPVVVRYVGGL